MEFMAVLPAIRFMKWTTVAVGSLAAVAAQAGDLSYTPINPSFGGNPNNASFLMQGAEGSNTYKRKHERVDSIRKELDNPYSGDPIKEFSRTLQSRLLSGLSDKIANAIYGDNAQSSGTFVVNGTTVSFNNVGGVINLTVSNGISTTNITLPGK
jgi:curli production assembly/transport component CsgF